MHTHTHTHTHTYTHTHAHTQVTYSIEGFLDKNKDLLFKDLSQAMYACERPLLKELFPEGIMAVEVLFY